MGLIRAAMGDTLITSMWVFSMPFLGVVASIITSFFGVDPNSFLALFLTINVVAVFVFTFSVLSAAMGGANFNPSTSVALYAAGLKGEKPFTELAVQLPAQAVGGIIGVIGSVRAVPEKYVHVLRGPSLKVEMNRGAAVEVLIAFAFCLVLLLVVVKGPRMFLGKVWLLSLSTVVLKLAGNGFTGAPMNPANAYGWAYVKNQHNSLEFCYVYLISPLIGSILAAWLFKWLCKPPQQKKKTE